MLSWSRLGARLRHGLDGAGRGTSRQTSRQAGHGGAGKDISAACPAVSLNRLEFMLADGIRVGDWPAALDTVPDWILRADRANQRIGCPPCLIRTRRQFDDAVAKCTAALEKPMVSTKVSSVPVAPALPPAEAARRFLAWLRAERTETNSDGYSDKGLREAYAAFCEQAMLDPSPEPTMRKYLAQLSGVRRDLEERGKKGGFRQRGTLWVIEPSLAQSAAVQKMHFPAAQRKAA